MRHVKKLLCLTFIPATCSVQFSKWMAIKLVLVVNNKILFSSPLPVCLCIQNCKHIYVPVWERCPVKKTCFQMGTRNLGRQTTKLSGAPSWRHAHKNWPLPMVFNERLGVTSYYLVIRVHKGWLQHYQLQRCELICCELLRRIAYISIFCRVYSTVVFLSGIIHYLQMFVYYILPRN